MRPIVCVLAASAALALAGAAPATGPLVGTFQTTVTGRVLGGVWTLKLAAGGAYTITFGKVVVIRGTAAFAGSTITFGREHGPLACVGGLATGVYTWKLVAAKLRLTRIRDGCPGRRQVLAHVFTRIA